MDPISVAGQVTKVTADCYNIFSQIGENDRSQGPILEELHTEVLRLRGWEQGWNLGGPETTREGQRHLDPNDIHYGYALASLVKIVAGFASVVELQSTYTQGLRMFGKNDKPKSNNTLAPITSRITKSPCPNTIAASSLTRVPPPTQQNLQLGKLRFWEDPKTLMDNPQSVPGLGSLNEVTQRVQNALAGRYCNLHWSVLTDKGKYQRIVCQLKKYIDGLFDILPPWPLYLPRSSPPHTAGLELSFNVPFEAAKIEQAPHFVQRVYFNKLLRSQIEQGARAGNINQVVLYGMGGMGKTQLALNYISSYFRTYSAIFWVNAASEQTMRLEFINIMQRLIHFHASDHSPDYAQIGQLLGTAGKLDSRSGTFSIQDPTDEDHVVEAVRQWLATEGNIRWLLVFDNLDDLESFDINNYIPSCRHGTIIITSRRWESLSTRRGFEVKQMQKTEAQALLLQSSCREFEHLLDDERNEEEKAIAEIAEKFEYLPLALDHAGSYIFKEQCTFKNYLTQLESNITLYLNKGWIQGGDGDKQSVFASWEMSLEVLGKRVPKAVDLLSICGFLDNNDICDEFLQRGMEVENDGQYGSFMVCPINDSATARHPPPPALSPASYFPYTPLPLVWIHIVHTVF